ncbi:MAG TPA: flagellar basal body P-ring protein FlgI [Polyangiaceae bacterium]|nr:flagellar basal body P-ring protein FlgI [Polyangiaceae bacterium]
MLDLCDVVGVRDNQLVGYGVVTGLNGTGDDVIAAPFAAQSLRALMRRLGVQIPAGQLRLRNVAAVVVTADLPPFARSGARLDVTVSSIGNAKSLRGGVLVQTPLRGADRRVYAVGQGALLVGGFSASGSSGSSVQDGVTTTARIPGGSLVEREVPTAYAKDGELTLALRSESFVTANKIVTALEGALGKGSATALDGGAVRVKVPAELRDQPVALLAKISEVKVDPAAVARVVVNERTGTIVAGGDVKLMPVAIAQGGITISVRETPTVSQPGAFSNGTTAVVKQSEVDSVEPKTGLTYVDGAASLADVAQALSTFGVSPRELASVLQALRAAGALRAEVIVQ